ICQKEFKTKKILREHHKTHQIYRKMYNCDQCDKSFTRKSNLKVHINVVHNGKRPFKCTYEGCDKSFAYKHILLRHIKSHHQNNNNKNNNDNNNNNNNDDECNINNESLPKRKKMKIVDEI